MDESTLCATPVSEDNSRESYVYSCSSGRTSIKDKQCADGCMKEVTEDLPQDILNVLSSRMEDDRGIQAPRSSLGEKSDTQSLHVVSSGANITTVQDGVVNSKEISIHDQVCSSVNLDEKLQKGLRKCVTFPCSVHEKQSELLHSMDVQASHLSTGDNSSYARSMSLPTSFRLVSAMKGGRAQNGIIPTDNLNVKWAPEVYDPPATSMSHTVKSYQQRPKSRKKDTRKNKSNRGKSSRESNNARKNSNRKNNGSAPDPLELRLELGSDGPLLNGYVKAAKGAMDIYAVNGQDLKCRISFLEEGLSKVHLSVTEAS